MSTKFSRQKLQEESKRKFRENLTKRYVENKDLPVLEAQAPQKKPTNPLPKNATRTTSQSREQKQASFSGANKGIPNQQVGRSGSQARMTTKSETRPATTTKPDSKLPATMSGQRLTAQASTMQPSAARTASAGKPKKAVGSFGTSVRDKANDFKNPPKQSQVKKSTMMASLPPKKPSKLDEVKPSLKEVQKQKLDAAAKTVESQIQARIDKNKQFIATLQGMAKPPPYASSLLQSARHNKGKVLEAHLTIMAGEERVKSVNLAEKETGRNSLMFTSFYQNLDAVEFLLASDAVPQLIDKQGRSAMHYAAINDNAKLIETLFLVAKSEPRPIVETSAFEEQIFSDEVDEAVGTVDERFGDMRAQMDLIDSLFRQPETTEPVPCKTQYARGIMNHRDHKGRTPLHMAVAFNNKAAAECLLYLGANPHVDDCYGQRPIDVCYIESLKSLLEIKMASTSKPTPVDPNAPQQKEVHSARSSQFNLYTMPTKMNKSLTSTMSSKEDKTYPIEIRDIRQVPKEKVISAKIGVDGDTYLMYAIKTKRIDVLKFLLREVPELDLLAKNSQGMTALHLAIRSNSCQTVKVLFIRDHKNQDAVDNTLKNPQKIDDIKGNLSPKSVKMLSSLNLRNMTPLISSVDHGNYEIFRFIVELCLHIQKTMPNHRVFDSIVDVKDEKQETAILKAVRLGRLQMIFTFLHLIGPNEVINYKSITHTDSTGKNILHHAVINKQKDLISRIVAFDTDHSLLRKQKDAKGKIPQAYDDSSQFTQCFTTIFDCSGGGSTVLLKQVLDQMDVKAGVLPKHQKTCWLGNTALHVAVKHCQLEIIKQLVNTYKVDIQITNKAGQTAEQLAFKTHKDRAMIETIVKLLQRRTTSTKVDRNKEARQENRQYIDKKKERLSNLRDSLKEKLLEQEIDIKAMYSRFDKNGDGVFSPLEFECAFTVLNIDFAKDDLRELIRLTDTNKDGKVDMNEFHAMLYASDFAEQEDEAEPIIIEESDSEEETKQPAAGVSKGGRVATGLSTTEKLRQLADQKADKNEIEEDIEEQVPETIQEEDIEESIQIENSAQKGQQIESNVGKGATGKEGFELEDDD